MKLKDEQKPQDKKNVVYKIKYDDCTAVHVRLIKIHENKRLREHHRALEKRGKKNRINNTIEKPEVIGSTLKMDMS